MMDPCIARRLCVALLGTGLWAAPAPAAPPRPELLQSPTFLQHARQVYAGQRAARRLARAAAAEAPAKHVVTRGALRPLVLLVDFPDRPHDATGHEPADYSGILFADNGPALPSTVREYYAEVSYGALRIGGDPASIQGWRRLDTPLSTYVGGDQGYSLGGRLVADAVAAADDAVDFGQFDDDGPDGIPNSGDDDGIVDALIVVHAGWGWEDSGRPQDLASHYNTASLATGDPAAGGGTIRIADYVLAPEESYKLDLVRNGAAQQDGNEPLVEIGVLCHELGHLLGLPDLYDTTFQSYGVGNYCLMGYGMWGANYPQDVENNRIKNSPTHLSPWAKKRLGWLEPTPVWTEGDAFDLRWVETYPEALVLYADSQAGEYFLVEHRKSVGFDAAFASYGEGGLLLWHVDERALAAGGPTPNDDWANKGVDVVCANGLDASGRDDLDRKAAFANTAHWYVAPFALPPWTDGLPGPADSRTALGSFTGIRLDDLSPPSTGDFDVLATSRMTGTASAGIVVLDPRSAAAAPGDHALDLSWSPSLSGDVTGYRLYFALAQGADSESVAEAGGADAAAYRLTGLADDTLYRLRLVARDADGNESDGVTVLARTLDTSVDTTPPTASADPAGGLSRTPVGVTLSMSEPGRLFYTLGGGVPTTGSTPYDGPLTIAQTATLRFLAVDAAGNESPVYAETYTIDTVAPTAAATPPGRASRTPVEVTLAASEAGRLFYTLDGSLPTTGSSLYGGPLTIAETATLRFLAVDEAGNESPAYAETYTIDAVPPTASASPAGLLSRTPVEVTLSMSEPGQLVYTLDGSQPTTGSTPYDGPLAIAESATLRFLAVDEAGNESAVYDETYTIDAVPPIVAAVPPGRTFFAPFYVALSADEPATIHYTLDGSEPGDSSPVYAAPLPVEATTTLKFLGIDEAGNASPVVTEQYTHKARDGGGGGGGGCFVVTAGAAATPAPWGIVAAAGALLLGGRRRRR